MNKLLFLVLIWVILFNDEIVNLLFVVGVDGLGVGVGVGLVVLIKYVLFI